MIRPLVFVKEVFSENGQGSFSRVAQGSIVFAVIGWVTYLVLKTHSMPDLSGPSLFVGTGAAGHYGINKAQDMITAFRSNGNGNPAPPVVQSQVTVSN